MKIKEGGGMDAQQQKFELAIKEAFPNSPQYLNKNPDGTYRNTTTFGAWIGWKLAAKAQAVPEKDVVIKKLSDQLYEQEMKTSAARVLCETACELLDDYAHQDAMVILNDLEQAMSTGASQ